MAATLDLQFNTQYLDLVVKKSATASFVVTVIGNYGFNIQNALIIAEVRRTAPGFLEASKVTASTTASQATISLKHYPSGQDSNRALSRLPIQAGDLITVEGSGITASKALSVTASQILVSNNATTTLLESRIKYRSLALASFTPQPLCPVMSIATTGASQGQTQLGGITGISQVIPVGTRLVFISNNTTVAVTTSLVASPGDTTIFIQGAPAPIASGSTSFTGAQMITTTQSITSSSTTVTVQPLLFQMASGTVLQFASKTSDGWSYVGSVNLSANTDANNTTTLSINNISIFNGTEIPAGSVAMFSTLQSNQFRLTLDSVESQFIPSGEYGYDVICRFTNGEVIRILEGKCTFLDNWSAL